MGSVLLLTVMLAVAAALGFFAGLFIRGADRQRQLQHHESCAASHATAVAERAISVETAALQTFLSGLQQLTRRVATDVGQHSHRVQEINEELVAVAPTETKILATVKTLIHANETVQHQLSTAEMRLQAQAQDIERHVRDARTDALTKLGNRRALEEELRRCTQSTDEGGAPGCLVVLNLDRFRKFNDTYGHPAGDEVLRGVARVLREQLAGSELACRHGGEEFSVLFFGAELETAKTRASRLRRAIGQEIFPFEDLDLRVTVSAGLARFVPGETPEDAFRRCNEALAQAKKNGRNCGCWHDGQSVQSLEYPGDATLLNACSEGSTASNSEAGVPGSEAATSDWTGAEEFVADLDRRIAEWKRGGTTLSLLVLELDGQSRITAALGETGIETASQAVMTFLAASLRPSDHAAQVKPGRFAVILPGVPLTAAGETAKRIRTEMARSGLKAKNQKIHLTVSAGVSEVTEGDERNDVLTRAARCLAAAKKAGGNCSFLSSKPKNAGATA